MASLIQSLAQFKFLSIKNQWTNLQLLEEKQINEYTNDAGVSLCLVVWMLARHQTNVAFTWQLAKNLETQGINHFINFTSKK